MHDDHDIVIIVYTHTSSMHSPYKNLLFSEQSFYRSVIVYVSLGSSFLGLSAIIIMKILEILKERRRKKEKGSESESHSHARTNYGSIQKGTIS